MDKITRCIECHDRDLDQGYMLSCYTQEVGPICQRCGLNYMQSNMDLPQEAERVWRLSLLGELVEAEEDVGK